ncbi:hypothetical protein B0T21DRAFT_367162 [Apiosordaria backusii]|uniref:Secreted protein n=1 Tax=Apiosordaria backusii TaxID=314023 RepID=A0AA40BLR6_9PEZI|nr:hypothetical protein B0T21DRAFT_367162 [Apiosordaria backusii]
MWLSLWCCVLFLDSSVSPKAHFHPMMPLEYPNQATKGRTHQPRLGMCLGQGPVVMLWHKTQQTSGAAHPDGVQLVLYAVGGGESAEGCEEAVTGAGGGYCNIAGA